MKQSFRLIAFVAFLAISVADVASAQERATLQDAQALTDRAVAHMQEVGPEAAIKDFNDPKGGYADHDLFVIVYDSNGIIMTGVPALIGKNALSLTDVTGKEFGKEIIEAAREKDGSWVEYHMTNPATKKVEIKNSYVRRYDKYVVFVGAYKA